MAAVGRKQPTDFRQKVRQQDKPVSPIKKPIPLELATQITALEVSVTTRQQSTAKELSLVSELPTEVTLLIPNCRNVPSK